MRTFLDMPDKDISDIVRILYQTHLHEKILSIHRFAGHIEVVMEAYHICDDGTSERLADDDKFVLTESQIIPYSFNTSDERFCENNKRYQQFLFAKGYHWINQYNGYIS